MTPPPHDTVPWSPCRGRLAVALPSPRRTEDVAEDGGSSGAGRSRLPTDTRSPRVPRSSAVIRGQERPLPQEATARMRGRRRRLGQPTCEAARRTGTSQPVGEASREGMHALRPTPRQGAPRNPALPHQPTLSLPTDDGVSVETTQGARGAEPAWWRPPREVCCPPSSPPCSQPRPGTLMSGGGLGRGVLAATGLRPSPARVEEGVTARDNPSWSPKVAHAMAYSTVLL